MDVLSDVLKKVKLSSAVYFKSDFSAPWGMSIPNGTFAQFHIVTQGNCLLKTEHQTIQLQTGDIIVFPFGTSHWLADQENSNRKEGKEVVQSILNGKPIFSGENISATLVCGHFDFDTAIDHPFIKELPELIHIQNKERKELSWLESISDLVIQEADKKQEGSEVIINKLGEILFVHTLRAYIQKAKYDRGFFAAIQDNRISKVLKAIHSSPESNWTLASMAQVAGMSRTSFSNRFKQLLGDTVLTYLTQWRILHAKELLKEGTKPVGEIAEMVGYKSEAAFNRVFKGKVSLSPLKFRFSSKQGLHQSI